MATIIKSNVQIPNRNFNSTTVSQEVRDKYAKLARIRNNYKKLKPSKEAEILSNITVNSITGFAPQQDEYGSSSFTGGFDLSARINGQLVCEHHSKVCTVRTVHTSFPI